MIFSFSKQMNKLADDVKRLTSVRILCNSFFFLFFKQTRHFPGKQQIELGAEVLHGQQSNNPLYQLAEEHQLIADGDSS